MNRSRIGFLASLIAFALWLSGCGGGTPKKPLEPSATPEQQRAAGAVASSQKAAVEALAAKIEKAANAGDGAFLDSVVNMEGIIDKAADGLALSQSTKRGILSGAAKNSLGQQIAALATQGGSYHFLRARQVGEKTTVLFRLLAEGGGANYHEYQIQSEGAGYKAADIYVFAAGENISDTMRRMLVPLAAEQNRGLMAKLTGVECEYVKFSDKIGAALDQCQNGKPAQALKTLDELPPSLRQNKAVLMIRFRCAALVGGKEYDDAMDEFARLFPNDPAADLLLIDSYFSKKQYDKVIQAIDSLEQRVGGNSWLKCMRGSMLMTSQKLDLAAAEFKKAVADEPGLQRAYWAWVECTLKQKDFRETARLLVELEDNRGVKIGALDETPLYADFVKSDDYKAWLGRTKKPPTPAAKADENPKPSSKPAAAKVR